MNESIKERIRRLPLNKQLLFGISCVKRMDIHIRKYLINREKDSAFTMISSLIDKIFFGCTSEDFCHIEDIIHPDESGLVEQLIPDTDEEGSNEAVFAQNAMIALAYCLSFIKEKDAVFIDYCGLKVMEVIDVWALNVLGAEDSDLLVSRETAVQTQLLKMIESMSSDVGEADVESFRQIVTRLGIT
ncbi:MAG: hypothetical protein ACTTKM_08290 [Prevotella fusca]|uniref:hypothetical protein n=1 Tax=Prevotella fusca TaxID=589436 RepID=UPI003F9FADB8